MGLLVGPRNTHCSLSLSRDGAGDSGAKTRIVVELQRFSSAAGGGGGRGGGLRISKKLVADPGAGMGGGGAALDGGGSLRSIGVAGERAAGRAARMRQVRKNCQAF